MEDKANKVKMAKAKEEREKGKIQETNYGRKNRDSKNNKEKAGRRRRLDRDYNSRKCYN